MAALLTDEEVREMRETCELFDPDNTGKLSRDSAAKVIRSTGRNPTEKELLDMFQSIDSDAMESDGHIDISELIDYYARKLYDPQRNEEEDAIQAFRAFDPKGKGTIELHNFKKIMTNLGEDTFSDIEFRQQILREISSDDEGKVHYKGGAYSNKSSSKIPRSIQQS